MKNKKAKKGKQTEISSFFSAKKEEKIVDVIDDKKIKTKKLKIEKTKKTITNDLEKEESDKSISKQKEDARQIHNRLIGMQKKHINKIDDSTGGLPIYPHADISLEDIDLLKAVSDTVKPPKKKRKTKKVQEEENEFEE